MRWNGSWTTAKNLCAVAGMAEAPDPAPPRPRIFRLQPVLALPQDQRVEFWTAAMLSASARQPRAAAVGSGSRTGRYFLPEVALESFPALAFLLLSQFLSLSQFLCVLKSLLSFAFFSSLILALASGSQIFSISLKRQSVRAFRWALALGLPPLSHRIFSPNLLYEDAAIRLLMARRRFRSPSYPSRKFSGLGWVIPLPWQRRRSFLSTPLLLASPFESEAMIPLVSRKHLVSSSTRLLSL